MGLSVELDQEKHLHFSVSGNFNCEISRAILESVKSHWRMRSTPVHADLGRVMQFSPCASVLLVLLLEMLNGNFYLGACNPDLEAAYVDALMTETPSLTDFGKDCQCNAGNGARCAALAP